MTFVLMFKNCTCLLVRPVCCCCSKLASISIWIKRLKFCRDESSSLWVVEEGLIHIRSRSNTLWSMLYSIEKHWEVGESRSSVAAVESMSSWGGPQSYPLQIKFSRQTLISSRTKLWVTWNGSRAAKTAQGIWIKNERILALWVITRHTIQLLCGKKDLKSRLWSTA